VKIRNKNLYYYLFIVLFSLILVLNLFLHGGEPATYDGRIHITNMAQYNMAISDGDVLVTWADGLANYGLPIPLFAQQLTPYIGSLINFVSGNSLFSYKLVYLLGAVLSSLLFYKWLRMYWKPGAALLAVFLFNFAPYRIINIYIRGAQPEFFASVFLPLILINLYKLAHKISRRSFIYLVLSILGLVLTHPMMLLVYSVIYIPYFLYLLYKNRANWLKLFFLTSFAFALGIGLASFYLTPLFLEMKYLYVGLSENFLVEGSFLGVKNFIDPKWYFSLGDNDWTRGHFIKSGLLETIIFVVGAMTVGYLLITKQVKKHSLFITFMVSGLISIFFLTRLSIGVYRFVDMLSKIQHPWRFLSAFMFIPPILLAIFYTKYPRKSVLIILILVIVYMRIPQLYGKNYVEHPEVYYQHTDENLQMVVFNTIWSGLTEEYPVKELKGEIIDGEGQIAEREESNSRRRYRVVAEERIRMADYTFYFPGWNVYIDGEKLSLRDVIWQDPEYRGVITYYVPEGEHNIDVVFESTKVRKAGYLVSLVSGVTLMAILVIRPKRFI